MGQDTGDIAPAGAEEELTTRLLTAAGASVTGADLDAADGTGAGDFEPESFTARFELGGPAGPRHVTVPFGLGLALAAVAGALVRMAGQVLDRHAVPVAGHDLLGPVLDLVPQAARPADGRIAGWAVRLPARQPRYEPRNLDFADGLDWRDLDGSFLNGGESGPPDYSASAAGPAAILSATAGRPAGPAALMQTLFADDYRGATVTFRGEFRSADAPRTAGLFLRVNTDPRRNIRGPLTEAAALADPDNTIGTVSGGPDWVRHQVTTQLPGDCDTVAFGTFMAGSGLIEMRGAELIRGS